MASALVASRFAAADASGSGQVDLSEVDLRAGEVPAVQELLAKQQHRVAVLDLSANELGDEGVAALLRTAARPLPGREGLTASSAVGGTAVEELNMAANGIMAAGAAAVADALLQRPAHPLLGALVSLDLSENTAGPAGAAAMSRALAGNRSLRALHLGSNELGAHGARVLAEALRFNRALESLNLRYNYLGPAGARALAAALEAPSSTLRELDLTAAESGAMGAEGVRPLAAALRVNSALRRLVLRGNALGDDGAAALAAGLARNSGLEALDLSQNGLTAACAPALAAALRAPGSRLLRLNLCLNRLRSAGVEALVRSGGGAPLGALEWLDVSGNAAGAPAAAALAEALLAPASRLRVLRAGLNPLRADGAAALAAALKRNTALQSLALPSAGAGSAGCAAVLDALEENASLRRLDLSQNGVGDDGVAGLPSALRLNRSLRELDLSRNRLVRFPSREVAHVPDLRLEFLALVGMPALEEPPAEVAASAPAMLEHFARLRRERFGQEQTVWELSGRRARRRSTVMPVAAPRPSAAGQDAAAAAAFLASVSASASASPSSSASSSSSSTALALGSAAPLPPTSVPRASPRGRPASASVSVGTAANKERATLVHLASREVLLDVGILEADPGSDVEEGAASTRAHASSDPAARPASARSSRGAGGAGGSSRPGRWRRWRNRRKKPAAASASAPQLVSAPAAAGAVPASSDSEDLDDDGVVAAVAAAAAPAPEPDASARGHDADRKNCAVM